MSENKKTHGFRDALKDGLDYVAKGVLANISPPITEGAERVMQRLEDRLLQIQEKMIKRLISLAVIGVGAIFLVFALFFYMREFLGWSNTLAFFSIGIVMVVVGLLLKISELKR